MAGVPFIKHMDGNVMPVLDILVDEVGIDGLHSLEPAAGIDIAEVKKKYGKRLVLLGNLDCGQLLTHGTQEQIDGQVRRILSQASPGGGHVFTSSNCIHHAVPYKNLHSMVQSLRSYGSYPIVESNGKVGGGGPA